MRISFVKTSLAVFAGIASAMAQTAVPDSTPQPPAAPSAAATPKADGPTETSAMDYLMNRKPQDGSAGQQAMNASRRAEGKAIAEDAVGVPRQEDPDMRARFERYLSTAAVPQKMIDDYFASMKEVTGLLRDNKVFEAWKKLYDLSEYQVIDAGVSRELANRVESIWMTGRATDSIDRTNDQLRKDVKTANANADMISERVADKEVDYQRRINQGNRGQKSSPANNAPNGGVPMAQDNNVPQQASVAGLEGKLQLTEEYLRSLELKAKIKLNELKQEKLLEQAKKDFSEYVSTLFNSGRLNHVVLAADFYRKLFQEGEYPVEMAQQVNAALEINRDVASAIEVVQYKVAKKQLSGANDSLQQAFTTSELNPAVLGLNRDLKEQIADFNFKLDQMRNLIEARDFGNLEALLSEIKATAVDFDTTKPTAIVNAVKLESQMRLGKAKLFAQQGNLEKAMEEFQGAAQAWPGNPDLKDKALTFFNTQDVQSQALTEFDRLVEEQNYRAIFDKQLAFAPAIRGDAKREDSLKTALEAIKNAEMASEKANVLMLNGDYFGAWEVIELASTKLPDDKKLNKLRADLSGRSAEFVAAINKARDAESRKEYGFSLTWYVNAQRQYPASSIANEAIERLTKQLLGGKQMASASGDVPHS